MNRQKSILVSVLVLALALSSFIAIANAGSSYSYTLTMDCPGGIDVPKGDKVNVTATTSNSAVTVVTFKWYNPSGQKVREVDVQKDSNGQFKDGLIVNVLGSWVVKAYFQVSGTDPYKQLAFKVTLNKYELICIPPCGSLVQLGTSVTSTANTTNCDIDKVNFTWTDPSGQIVETQVPVTKYYKNGQYVYSLAVSTRILDKIGDWCVKAEFIDMQGVGCHKVDKVIACRTQYFQVIPEIPMIGTVGASAAMLSGFAFKLKRKTKK